MGKMHRKRDSEQGESSANLIGKVASAIEKKEDPVFIKMEETHKVNARPHMTDVDGLLVNYRQRLKEMYPNTYFYRQRKVSDLRNRKITTPILTNRKARTPAKKHASLDTTHDYKKHHLQDQLVEDGSPQPHVDLDDDRPCEQPLKGEKVVTEEQFKFVSNEEWLRALEYTIATGNHILLSQYIQGFDLKKQKTSTLLHLAVNENQEECAKMLLQYGSSINANDDLGRSPIFYALFNKNKKMLEFLLNNKADPDLQDIDSMTVVLYASAFGLSSFLEVLATKANLALCNEVGRSVLHYAAVQREPRCLEILLPHVMEHDIDMEDNKQETPLHLAALAKREKNIRLLLKYEADPNVLSKTSLTPAHYSAFLWDTSSLKEFIHSGEIDINLEDHKGRTLLHLAALENPANLTSSRSQADCLQYLAQLKDIELNKVDKVKETALGYAVRHDSNLARLLIAAGANVDGMKKLKTKGLEIPSVDYTPPLHQAAKYNQLESVSLLLEKKAVIDVLDENKKTALHIASEEENVRVAEMLLQNDVDASIRAGDGKSPLEIAVEKMNPFLVNLIIQHAAYPVDNGVYEINLGVLLPKDKGKPETDLLNRINETFKDHYKKTIFMHPTIRAFLNLKVKCLSKLEIAWVIMTVLFLGLGFNFLFQDANCLFKHTRTDLTSNDTGKSIPEICYNWGSPVMISWLLWLLVMPTYLISEVMEFRSSAGSYVTNLENFLDAFLIISCIILCPWTFFPLQTHKVIVVIAMVACGLDFMLALGSMTSIWKVQMMMFRGVLGRAFILLIPFIPLLLCFTFSLHTVLQVKPQHQTVFYSFMESLGLTVGNIENPIKAEDPIEKKIALAFLTISFVFIIIIVMMNLLTGLAVNITEQFRTDALYRATQRRIITTNQKETMVLTFNFLDIKKCSLKVKLKEKGNDGKTTIRVTSSKPKSFSKITELWTKLRLNLGHVDEKEIWPMRWIGLNKRDIIRIERTRRKAQKSKIASSSLEHTGLEDDVDGGPVYSDIMSGDDMEMIEMQLGQLYQKMLQLEALMVNKPSK